MIDEEFDEQHDMDDETIVSKTQLKNAAKALFDFGKQLVEMSPAKLKKLPLSENTRNAIADFAKQSGHIARKRHLAYIGKCLRNDDVDALKAAISDDEFNQLRVQQEPGVAVEKDVLLKALIAQGDSKIQALLETHPMLDRQNLRQLVRNVTSAKTEAKKALATSKLKAFLSANQLN